MSQQHIILLLGSNLGDRKHNIDQAIFALEKTVGKIIKKTIIIETKAVEFASNNIFRNIALVINTHYSPIKTLKLIKKIEQDMGRNVDSKAHGAYLDRIIDIDIVSYENLRFACEKLTIPHKKHVFERDFSRELLKQLGENKKKNI